MRVEALDIDKGYVRLRIEGEDDLWLLSLLVEEGDIVASKTTRDVSIEGSAKRRLPMVLAIRVIATEFQPFSGRLRVRGVIVEGPEEYGLRGSHHTLSIDVGMSVEIVKRGGRIDQRMLDRILKLSSRARGLLVALDHDEYAIAVIQGQGVRYVDEGYFSSLSKRDPRSYERFEEELSELAKRIVEVSKSNMISIIAIASPGQIASRLAEILRIMGTPQRIITDSISSGGRAGVEEMLRRDTIARILGEQASIEAEQIIKAYLEALSRDPSSVATGLEGVYMASKLGAIKKAAILESLLKGDRRVREAVNEILLSSADKGYEILIVPQESPAGERLKMLGAAIALLRFPLYVESQLANSGSGFDDNKDKKHRL
jgi:protein pelota